MQGFSKPVLSGLISAALTACFLHSGALAAPKNPKNLEDGNRFFEGRNYLKAKAAYSDYIKDNPKDYRGYFGRGKTWIKLFNNAPAFYDLNKAVSLDGKDAELYSTRGILQVERGEFQSALKDLNLALKKGAENKLEIFESRAECYRLIGLHKQQIEQLTEILDLKQTPELFKKRADAYYVLKDYDNAIKDYSKVLESDPDSYRLLLRRGYCYEKVKDWKAAIADYTKIIDRDPKAYVILERRAIAHRDAGERQKALDDISKAIYHFRGYSARSMYLMRAKLYKELGDNAKAAKDFAKYNKGRPKKR